jgi:hypothetical protein
MIEAGRTAAMHVQRCYTISVLKRQVCACVSVFDVVWSMRARKQTGKETPSRDTVGQQYTDLEQQTHSVAVLFDVVPLLVGVELCKRRSCQLLFLCKPP